MSVSAPPRPRPTGAVIGWFVDDGQRHSRINVVPVGNTVDSTERFATTLTFFRGARP